MKELPTAEEFCKNYTRLRSAMAIKDLTDCMIDFAKLHLQEAQNAWFEKIKSEGLVTDRGISYLESLYSQKNIK